MRAGGRGGERPLAQTPACHQPAIAGLFLAAAGHKVARVRVVTFGRGRIGSFRCLSGFQKAKNVQPPEKAGDILFGHVAAKGALTGMDRGQVQRSVGKTAQDLFGVVEGMGAAAFGVEDAHRDIVALAGWRGDTKIAAQSRFALVPRSTERLFRLSHRLLLRCDRTV